MSLNINPYYVKDIRALHDDIIVKDMVFDERITSSGIVLRNDDMKSHGIRPRWAQVFKIGPNQKEIKVGQFVLIAHGRWTRGIKIETDNGNHTIRKVDNKDILCVSDEPIYDETLSDKEI